MAVPSGVDGHQGWQVGRPVPGRDRRARRQSRRTPERELNINFEALVSSEAAGYATDEELAILKAAPAEWALTLRRLLAETEAGLASVRRRSGPERDMALADLSDERDQLLAALERLEGRPVRPKRRDRADGDRGPDRPSGREGDGRPGEPRKPVFMPPALQASWDAGQVVLWAGSPSVPRVGADELDRLLAEAGAGAVRGGEHPGIPVPAGGKAAAVSAPLTGALGWLVGMGAHHLAEQAAPSLRWLGEVAVWATELAVQGRVVPSLTGPPGGNGGRGRSGGKGSSGKGQTGKGTAEHTVEWVPALVDPDRLRHLAARMPGAVAALSPGARPEHVCRSVLGAAVDAIFRAGAARLVTAATSPVARSRVEIAESVLAGLNGTPFTAAVRGAAEVGADLARWSAPVTGDGRVHLTLRLAAPEDDGGWLLSVEAPGPDGHPVAVEQALSPGRDRPARVAAVETELRRLERLFPALQRTGRRRGRVLLHGTEAWEFMTTTGALLEAAGFGVRVPALSPRKPTTRLQLHATALDKPSMVGAQELSQVRWSVLVDDVELDAGTISRLATQARPLLKVGSGWVELDKADLEAAAAALAERQKTTELSGAAILRAAVGLDSGPLGPAVVDGGGWAVDLVRKAAAGAATPLPAPEGFEGRLRHYQAEARGWLGFLDRAGLGGCLAMDMGLGKTPVALAHLLERKEEGPALVIAPPAVLGNWANEAGRFTPGLRVRIHHGSARATAEEVAAEVAATDVLLTTYGTAIRDVEALAGVDWARVIIDEAQTIKNPASDTAVLLRRIPARSRLALTGTPVENGLSDLWSILDFTNPGLVGGRNEFVDALSRTDKSKGRAGEGALRALNGLLVFRRTKAEPEIAAELPDKIDELDHCAMTTEQVGLYQAVLDRLLAKGSDDGDAEQPDRKGHILAAITALKQICDHPAAYLNDDPGPLTGRSGKLTRLEELVEAVFFAGERMLIFTHFARWGERLAAHLTERTGVDISCYHGGLSRGARDKMVREFQEGRGPGALVLSIKAGGTGLNLTSAGHVVLYDRWWNPAVEDQARDRAWRIGQAHTVVCHRLVCPGTVDERVEEVVEGKRRIADLVLPASSSLGDLDAAQLRTALGLRPDALVEDPVATGSPEAAA